MPNIWSVNPSDGMPSPEIQAEMARLQAELAAMEALGDEAACKVCGSRENITEEHTPSRKAGNPLRAVKVSIDSPGIRALPRAQQHPEVVMNPVKIAEAFYTRRTSPVGRTSCS